jgi:hypothetical protein
MATPEKGLQTPIDELAKLAGEAFIYGFPLVFDLQEVERFTRVGMGALAAAPLNVFSHATTLAGPKDKFVSINNDTIYSIANLDVSGGPVRLEVPDADGRYYVLQFVDAWTNNFAYIGRRATGTSAGSFMLVPPDWDGAEPADATVIRFPTAVASIVGRWAVEGEDDLPAVRALQQGLTLTPSGEGDGIPELDPDVPEDQWKLPGDCAANTPRTRGRAVLGPGGTISTPPGEPHTVGPAGEDAVEMIVEFRPSLGFERFVERTFALDRAGHLNARGRGNPLRLATARPHEAEFFVPRVPIVLQRAILRALDRLGRWLAGPHG